MALALLPAAGASAGGTYGSCTPVVNPRICAYRDANYSPSNSLFSSDNNPISSYTNYLDDSVHSWNDTITSVNNVAGVSNAADYFFTDANYSGHMLTVNDYGGYASLTSVQYDSVHSFNDAISSSYYSN